MEKSIANWAERGIAVHPERPACRLCGKPVTGRGGMIPQPVDRRPAGYRCAACYRRYLRKYFPEALA